MRKIRVLFEWILCGIIIVIWPIASLNWVRHCWGKNDADWKKFAAYGIIGSCAIIDLVYMLPLKLPYSLYHSIPSGIFYMAGCILQFNLIMKKAKDEGLWEKDLI